MIKPTANSRFAKAGVWCFYDTVVLKIPAFAKLQTKGIFKVHRLANPGKL
jgi:hypothetical protein